MWTLAAYVHRRVTLPCERCEDSQGCLWQWWWVCTLPLAPCPVVCSPALLLSDRHREEEISHHILPLLTHILQQYFLQSFHLQYLYTQWYTHAMNLQMCLLATSADLFSSLCQGGDIYKTVDEREQQHLPRVMLNWQQACEIKSGRSQPQDSHLHMLYFMSHLLHLHHISKLFCHVCIVWLCHLYLFCCSFYCFNTILEFLHFLETYSFSVVFFACSASALVIYIFLMAK